MDYNASIPCLYCAEPTPRTAAKQHTCQRCWKRHMDEFGPNWFEAEWHHALLPDYTMFVHDSKLLSRALSIERDGVDFATEDIVEPVESLSVRHPNVYQAVYTLYATQHLGCRRIKRALDEAGVRPSVNLATVKRYLVRIKEECGIAEQSVPVQVKRPST